MKKLPNQVAPKNFYLEAIQSDLKISDQMIKRMKTYECQKCFVIQNNPWFSQSVSKKIYSNIYGQHNRSWSNLINFVTKGKEPNHGSLFSFIKKNIKIKHYAEFNSPFMGIMLNFFSEEYKKNLKFYKNFFNNIIGYLTSRQVAGKSKKIQKQSKTNSKKFFEKINSLKKKFYLKKKVNKYLFTDYSNLCWGENDNLKSVNSKTFASEFLETEIRHLKDIKKNYKFDLFGIFHTLDHTFEPKKILDFALNNSKYVLVYCHVEKNLEKQHLFTLTENFLKYLSKQKIYNINLTHKIKKNYRVPELYFICSKNEKLIKNLN